MTTKRPKMNQLLAALATVAALLAATLLTPWTQPDADAATSVEGCDYNGDGYADLAMSGQQVVSPYSLSGRVHVLYGTNQGLSATGSQEWTRNSPGLPDHGEHEEGHRFGDSLQCGDFDGDGRDDLVVLVRHQQFLHVLNGTDSGLTATGSLTITRSDLPSDTHRFDRALAAGDFNGDGYEDLVLTTTRGGSLSLGRVVVLAGSPTGLDLNASTHFLHLSSSLAVGDFNGDAFTDLAIGVPSEDIGGRVLVAPGSSTGLDPALISIWTRDSPGIKGTVDPSDGFGHALAAGDFDGDGNGDLAIGLNATGQKGSFNVLYGSSTGLTATGDQLFSLDSPGIKGQGSTNDRFGRVLAAGDFDNDGYSDLIAGTPAGVGYVSMIPGSPSGLTDIGDERWSQDSPGIKGRAETGDDFGGVLATGDFDGNGRVDAAISARLEDFLPSSRDKDNGIVHILPGGGHGLTAVGDQLWSQASAGVSGSPRGGDQFGLRLAGS